jgi:predicted dehydrogenase
MKALKLGIIGTGGILRGAHMRGWTSSSDVEIVAFCDISEERAKALADDYGVSRIYTDYRELLAQPDIDIVDICTPNVYHSEIAVAALQAGKHVFCEKPDAINPEEAMKMAHAALTNDKVLMTMRNNRFRPASQFLKKYIEGGHMGEIYTGRCGWVRRRGIPGKGGWFTTKELSGGGPLIDLGVHFIDLAIWLMGNPKPVSVVGATYTKFANSSLSDSVHSRFGQPKPEGTFDVEDLATGFIRFESGATLQIEFSWASNVEEEMNFLELRGTQSGFSFKKGELKLFSEIEGVLCDIHPKLSQNHGGHEPNIHHFVDVVLGRAEPIFLPQSGIDMIQILSALYKSAETAREVVL